MRLEDPVRGASPMRSLVLSLLACCGRAGAPAPAASPPFAAAASAPPAQTFAFPEVQLTPQPSVTMRSDTELPPRLVRRGDRLVVEVGDPSRARRAAIEDATPDSAEVLVLWYPAWEIGECPAAAAALAGSDVVGAARTLAFPGEIDAAALSIQRVDDGGTKYRVTTLETAIAEIDRTDLPVAMGLVPVPIDCPDDMLELATRAWEPTTPPDFASARIVYDPASIWLVRTSAEAESFLGTDAGVDFAMSQLAVHPVHGKRVTPTRLPATRATKVRVSVLRVPVPLYSCEIMHPREPTPVARKSDDFTDPVAFLELARPGYEDVAGRYRLPPATEHVVVVGDVAEAAQPDPGCKDVWAPIVVRSRKQLAAAHMTIEGEFDFSKQMLVRIGRWPIVASASDIVSREPISRAGGAVVVRFPLPMRVASPAGNCRERIPRCRERMTLEVDWSVLHQPIAIPRSSGRVRLDVRRAQWADPSLDYE